MQPRMSFSFSHTIRFQIICKTEMTDSLFLKKYDDMSEILLSWYISEKNRIQTETRSSGPLLCNSLRISDS